MKTSQTPGDLRNAWPRFPCEMVGTALLVLVSLSLVIEAFGTGSPVAASVPSLKLRQVLTGFLFGCVGGLITISRLGKVSGAHTNLAVTFGFWMTGKIEPPIAAGYIVTQLIGAVLGCLPVISGHWVAWWIYWVRPLGGALASLIIFSFLTETIEEAKLHHFEWDYRKLFRTSLASDYGN